MFAGEDRMNHSHRRGLPPLCRRISEQANGFAQTVLRLMVDRHTLRLDLRSGPAPFHFFFVSW